MSARVWGGGGLVYKTDVDGATSEHDKKSNIGVVIRDNMGQLTAALSKLLQAQYIVELVEVMAMEQGVLLA